MFTYFEGPPEEMLHRSRVLRNCVFCGASDYCFSLDCAHCLELETSSGQLGGDPRIGQYGCQNCLKSGRFEFSHDTELGLILEEDVAILPGASDISGTQALPQEAVKELLKTPDYRSCQQPLWLTHCGDFMVYLGAWQPADFHHKAPDGDGRALFQSMAPEYAEMWDGAVEKEGDGLTPTNWGDAGCYAFRCRHCGVLRAHCDWY